MSQRSRQRKQQEKEERETLPPKQKLNFELKRIKPLTHNQELVFRNRNEHQLLYGVAGTGKSFLALYHALDDVIERGLYKRVVLIRSTVASRDQGHLPGDDKQKAAIYELPYIDICANLFGRADAYEILKNHKIIDFRSSSYARGVTLSDCVIIIDEAQNMDRRELETLLTRLGENARVVICGDIRQNDLLRRKEKTGLADVIKIINKMDCFVHVEFDFKDIVRSPFVKAYITAAAELESQNLIEPL